MSTKNNPGAFRCFEAALPDEPIFTILARDPAAPATLRFWADERERLGKTDNPDDLDRIDDARRDADLMRGWREANLDPVGTGPTWRGVTITDELGGPIRTEPDNTVYIYAERDGDEAVRLSIEWLQARTKQLLAGDISREFFGELIGHACRSPDRRRDRVVPVEEAAADAAKRDARTITMMNAMTNAIRLLDDLVAPEPTKRLSTGTYNQIEAIRRTLLNGLAEAPVAEAKVALQTPGEQVVVDSQPDDLAHAPEVPPHRFSVFHKGEKYAYARGLEINPIHLPTALDAMDKDGWNLVAIFGQTDSQHVGFIFRRAYTGGLVSDFRRAYPEPHKYWLQNQPQDSEKHRRFMAGEPLDEIRADDPPVVESVPERFVIEYVVRLPDGTGCRTVRAPASEWPEWAQPCFDRGRGMMP